MWVLGLGLLLFGDLWSLLYCYLGLFCLFDCGFLVCLLLFVAEFTG